MKYAVNSYDGDIWFLPYVTIFCTYRLLLLNINKVRDMFMSVGREEFVATTDLCLCRLVLEDKCVLLAGVFLHVFLETTILPFSWVPFKSQVTIHVC